MATIKIYKRVGKSKKGTLVKTYKNARYKTLGKNCMIYDLKNNKEVGKWDTDKYTWTSR